MSFTDTSSLETELGKVVGDTVNFAIDSADTDITTIIFPITLDAPRDPSADNVGSTGVLADQLAGDYVIERIVGKLFVSATQIIQTDSGIHAARNIEVGAGLFVARVNDQASGGGINTPIGSVSPPERVPNYSALHPDAIREPWMWRRTWMLSTQDSVTNLTGNGAEDFLLQTGGARTFPALFPTNNCQYGSMSDGPHIDVKSVRRVRNDERLFMSLSCWILDNTTSNLNMGFSAGSQRTQGLNVGILARFDGRLLGALRRARNSSNF